MQEESQKIEMGNVTENLSTPSKLNWELNDSLKTHLVKSRLIFFFFVLFNLSHI